MSKQISCQHSRATLNMIFTVNTKQYSDLHANGVLWTRAPPIPSCRLLSKMPVIVGVGVGGSAAISASLMVSCSLLARHRWKRLCPTGAILFGGVSL